MDSAQFDQLTRAFTRSLSRRRLGLTTAGVLAGLGGALPDEAAQAKRRCKAPGVKCKKDCCRGQKVCRDGKCRPCAGFRCPDGRCLTESCGGVCCNEGITCCSGVCCAAGETCSAAGACTPCRTQTENCDAGETQCQANDITGRCATSIDGGNYCVEYGFPCVTCVSDADCTAQLGQPAICIVCQGCNGIACALVLAPA